MKRKILTLLPLVALLACNPLGRKYKQETWWADVQQGSTPATDLLNHIFISQAAAENGTHGVDNGQFTYAELLEQGRALANRERARTLLNNSDNR